MTGECLFWNLNMPRRKISLCIPKYWSILGMFEIFKKVGEEER